RKETVAVVGSGPAGLTAAHDLCVAGYEVHVYEMTDRLGGMMIWGIPAFRLPPGIIEEDIARLMKRCPGLKVHLNTALGRDVSLDELKTRHDAVVLTIGAWWGKPMDIEGENDDRVVDGVGFLRKVNDGERPELPETVVVVGGGDVAMDACRAAKRLPGCKQVKVVYRRGPEEIPARRIELEGAIEEDIEFIYNTKQVRVETRGNQLALHCVRTEAGEPDEDGRRRPVAVAGSEHVIDCGMVIAAVGQKTECAELDDKGLMLPDRVRTDWAGMRTDDAKVFAAGDGAFGGSTIVMAMHHGQRAAYYVKAFLEGRDDPISYRTPYRTRRVPVAQDIFWERLPPHHPPFFGLGKNPIEFPEIEATYDAETAKKEAARCYRCDAETGSSDYAVQHREDIFSMARTNPVDHAKHRAMLQKRLRHRENPFPEKRPPTLDDLVFLPANLSRLVIDPYREACKVSTDILGKLELQHPFLVCGFDDAPEEVRAGVTQGLAAIGAGYLGATPPGGDVAWIQLLSDFGASEDPAAAGVVYALGQDLKPLPNIGAKKARVRGIAVSSRDVLDELLPDALDKGFDFLLLDGTGRLMDPWPELAGAPDLRLLRDAVKILRKLKREEEIDLVWFGGMRSGTDAAKLVALGAKGIVVGVPVALAAGAKFGGNQGFRFTSDYSSDDRSRGVANIIQASIGEASMMARCTGKTNLGNLEPEDLRAITLSTAEASGIPLIGTR
ncbi:MAG TPA: FAD-dependent oxidoreductase, partial [Gammaproteobacteria bacterium]